MWCALCRQPSYVVLQHGGIILSLADALSHLITVVLQQHGSRRRANKGGRGTGEDVCRRSMCDIRHLQEEKTDASYTMQSHISNILVPLPLDAAAAVRIGLAAQPTSSARIPKGSSTWTPISCGNRTQTKHSSIGRLVAVR